MDATAPTPDIPAPATISMELHAQKQETLILDALRQAIRETGEHRLFRSGKLAGLFPSRVGTSAEAALRALSEGLLETVRTEVKGRAVIEWARATPRGVTFLHDHESPNGALRELIAAVADARAGVPGWLNESRQAIARLAEQVEQQGSELQQRLDTLSDRLEAALRRSEAAVACSAHPGSSIVPWATEALAYLDRRASVGKSDSCTLEELFEALLSSFPELSLSDFHDGLRRLHDVRAVRLFSSEMALANPEFAMIVGAEMCDSVSR